MKAGLTNYKHVKPLKAEKKEKPQNADPNLYNTVEDDIDSDSYTDRNPDIFHKQSQNGTGRRRNKQAAAPR